MIAREILYRTIACISTTKLDKIFTAQKEHML